MKKSQLRRPIIAILASLAALAVVVGCGEETPTATSIPPAPETQQEAVEVAEAVPDLPTAPDFELPAANRDNTEISLSSFQGDKPVVLVFYRAYW